MTTDVIRFYAGIFTWLARAVGSVAHGSGPTTWWQCLIPVHGLQTWWLWAEWSLMPLLIVAFGIYYYLLLRRRP